MFVLDISTNKTKNKIHITFLNDLNYEVDIKIHIDKKDQEIPYLLEGKRNELFKILNS